MPRSSLATLIPLLLATLAGCDPAAAHEDDPLGAVLPRSAIDCSVSPDDDKPGGSESTNYACGERLSYPCLPHQDTTDKPDEEALCSEIWLEDVDGPVGVITLPGGRVTIAACDDDDACSFFADGEFRCEDGMCVGPSK